MAERFNAPTEPEEEVPVVVQCFALWAERLGEQGWPSGEETDLISFEGVTFLDGANPEFSGFSLGSGEETS